MPGFGLSLGGESVPVTVNASLGTMSLEQALAAGMFDNPDQPGTARIPVTIRLQVTPELRAALR